MPPPKRGKRDTNEGKIRAALQAVGATVVPLNQTGVCDLLVGFRGQNYLLEVKALKGKLTREQVVFFDWWQGQRAIVHTVDEALKCIGAIS